LPHLHAVGVIRFEEDAMVNFDLFRLRDVSDDTSPERWRLHIIGPAIALYAGFVIAVTLFSMAR